MKYKVIYRKYWKDGTFTEVDTMPAHTTELSFDEAKNLAISMCIHQWKFHQEDVGESVYYVKEI